VGLWKDKKYKQWSYSFQYQGQLYAKRGYKTRKEAAAAREDRRKELKTPTTIGMAFSEASNKYLDFAERRFASETYKYKIYVYKTFFAFLGQDLFMHEITSSLISSYLETRHSNNNYNVHRRELSALFSYAKDTLEVINRNPVLKTSKLPHNVAIKQIPKEEDVLKLLLVADHSTDEKDLLVVLLHTLARIDEALRLRWEDISFEKRIVTKWSKKTRDGSYKPIPVNMNDELHDTLWRRWEKREHEVWVFCNQRTQDRYYKRPKLMRSLCKKAGVPPFGFHQLRHLMASLMADNPKISTKTIQKILGHSAHRTTEIYLHELDGAIQVAMESISGRFSLKNPNPQQDPQQKTKKG
jgi:integrase